MVFSLARSKRVRQKRFSDCLNRLAGAPLLAPLECSARIANMIVVFTDFGCTGPYTGQGGVETRVEGPKS